MHRQWLSGLLRWIALGLVFAAILAPVAQASYDTDGGAVATKTGDVPGGVQAKSDGSSWSGAAAGIGVAVVLAAGGLIVLHRRRGRFVRA
jgi:hypothetical protein